MDNKEIQYSIVVPSYNEEAVIGVTYNRLKKVMDSAKESYEIIFVNDGSRDRTASILKSICSKDSNIKLISFSRNFGHQIAITAGMENSGGKAVVVIDADLQDPPEVILEMIEKWKQGYEVVYGKRLKRNGESFFKKLTAKLYYRTLKSMTEVDMPLDTGDFRLIDRKVCDALCSAHEHNRYVRGLISWLGFKQTAVEFVREERFAGETKYPLKKMLKLASDGITSFSYKPLKIAIFLGVVISAASFIFLLAALFGKFFFNATISFFMLAVMLSLLLNGLMFMMLGIIGEYIGRIYDEAKGRPLYIISERNGF